MEEICDMTVCCICAEMFRDPRILPCLHTFCLECLEETLSKADSEQKPGNTMPCPVCRQHFTIPTEGLRGSKKNFFMEQLMTVAKASRARRNTVSCGTCLENADESTYCLKCQDNLCDSCSLDQNQLSSSYPVNALCGSQEREELVKKSATQSCHSCDQHEMEQLKMYCTDCEKTICIVCFAESHQQHRCSDVNRAAEIFRSELEIHIEKIVEVFKEGVAAQQELEMDKKGLLDELVRTEMTIIDRATALKKLVDDHTKCLLDELAAAKMKHLKEIETKLDEIESYLAELMGFQQHCSEIKTKGTSSYICTSANDLRARGEDLRGKRTTRIPSQTSSIQLCFTSSNLEESLKMENIVGGINVQMITREIKLKTQEENQQVTVKLIKRLRFASVILGITKLHNKIYVLYGVDDSRYRYVNTIDVFVDESPFRLLKKVESKDIRNYRDIVSTDKFNCLFVSDTWNKCIIQISVDDYRESLWLSKVGESVTMSVSSDGHLLVLKKGQPSTILEICGLDAKLIRSTTLSSDIVCPVRVTQIRGEHFFIIHRLTDENGGSCVVSQISSDGMIIHQFNPKGEAGLALCPCNMSVDLDSQRLFVADSESENVIELDLNSLKYIGSLFTKQQKLSTNIPRSLHYDECKKMMIIGHSNRIKIYEVRRSAKF